MEKLSEWCDLGADCSTSLSEDNGRDEFIQIFSINGVADYPFRCTNDLFKYKLPLSSQSQE